MKKLFEGLEDLGFKDVEELAPFKPIVKSEVVEQKITTPVLSIDDCLFSKSHTCPVCDNTFRETAVKTSKARFVRTDEDLMPIYMPVSPFFYNVIMCEKCGYTALLENFSKITDGQCKLIKEHISPKFKAKKFNIPYSESEAIERYKLALLNSMIKNGRASEKGYICLVLSWLYKLSNDNDNRMLFVNHSYESFLEAYQKDSFPLYGMNEAMAAYLIAELAWLLGKHEDSLKWISRVLSSRNINPRIKEFSIDLKDKVKKYQVNGEVAEG